MYNELTGSGNEVGATCFNAASSSYCGELRTTTQHSSDCLFPSGPSTKMLSPTPATCPAHLILLSLITRIIFGAKYKLWSFSLWSFLHSQTTPFVLWQQSAWRTGWDLASCWEPLQQSANWNLLVLICCFRSRRWSGLAWYSVQTHVLRPAWV
jgi:hypothetical protein